MQQASQAGKQALQKRRVNLLHATLAHLMLQCRQVSHQRVPSRIRASDTTLQWDTGSCCKALRQVLGKAHVQGDIPVWQQ